MGRATVFIFSPGHICHARQAPRVWPRFYDKVGPTGLVSIVTSAVKIYTLFARRSATLGLSGSSSRGIAVVIAPPLETSRDSTRDAAAPPKLRCHGPGDLIVPGRLH